MVETGTEQPHIAAGRGRRHHVGAGLDAVRNDGMAGAVQAGDAADYQPVAAEAFDLRPHRDQTLRQIGDLGFAGGVDQHGLAFSEGGRHQQVFGGADRDAREHDLGAAQPFWRARLDIAFGQLDLGSEPLQPLQV